jgi:hypothetical protein
MLSTLTSLGLNENQAKVRLAVRQYRLSPASQIGALTGMERTHAYKILTQLEEKNLIGSSLRGKTSYFYVPDKSVLRSLIDDQRKTLKTKEDNLEQLENELDTLINPEHSLAPPIRQWTGNQWVEAGFNDCLKVCYLSGIKQISFFWSKTLESLATSTESLGQKWKLFFHNLKVNNIHLEWFEGTGILLLEQVLSGISNDEIQSLPTGSNALQVIIIWPHLYHIFYRREPVMLKITSPEMAELMRVLLHK